MKDAIASDVCVNVSPLSTSASTPVTSTVTHTTATRLDRACIWLLLIGGGGGRYDMILSLLFVLLFVCLCFVRMIFQIAHPFATKLGMVVHQHKPCKKIDLRSHSQ